MGHQCLDKVQQKILHRFDWPRLRKACESWVNACPSCLQVKDPRKMKFPLKSAESSVFNEVVQIDHQKICRTDSGYNQILVIIDHFTKLAEAVPCRTASAEETCDHLIANWISRYGCPMTFQSENGKALVGDLTFMMLTGRKRAMPLTFFYPEYEGKKTSPQAYVKEAVKRQQELNELCRRNTAQEQMRQAAEEVR